ncbi:OmcA/MtrC family decaheme c-type cytochrome [Desulfobacterota bacterium AH_259_B03_O07]|nr:OmcA/MtrC family decaheme c-type cytochrome [Desulfobacterota bacterium AH_259_B03_O07]
MKFLYGNLCNCFLLRIIAVSILLAFIYGGCSGGDGTVNPPPPPPSNINKLNVIILDAFIDANRQPVAMIRLEDENGNPLSIDDLDQINFIIARIVESGEYINYITRDQEGQTQATAERDGTFEEMDAGVFSYTFSTVLPENYNTGQTHTVAIYARRVIGSQEWISNATFDFVPNGGPVTEIRNIVVTEACNNCHDPLALHGGIRRATGVCITCHTTKIIDPDTGETVDQIDPQSGNNIGFKIMVHKIHRGEMLPSVEAGMPYFIVGFNGSVHDYSEVVFPQEIRNCTKCHTDQAVQNDAYKNDPTRAACGSCHDDVDFATATNHPTVQLTDNNCSGCHIPMSNTDFDISVTGAHTVPLRAKSLPGVNFEISDVRSAETGSTQVRPGEHAEVTFSMKTDAGEVITPDEMNSVSMVISGPTTDYFIQNYEGSGAIPGEDYFLRERGLTSAVGPDADGNFVYTFSGMIPTNASGTYAVGIEGRIQREVGGDNLILFETVNEAGQNVVRYFAVTDSVPVPRRMVVDNTTEDQFCNACHGTFSKDFSIHGNLRNNTEYCVMCHNPSADDIEVRPVPEGGTAITAAIDFKEMIHMIHTGENLSVKPYIIYGFGGSVHDFSNLLYPGNTSDCYTCHLANTNILNPGMGVLGDGVQASFFREFAKVDDENVVLDTFSTQPVIDACVSCHDNLGVNEAGNALTGVNHLGGAQPESACVECHAAGDPLGAAEVHLPALPPSERINRPEND